jgi:acetyl esterase/lipase
MSSKHLLAKELYPLVDAFPAFEFSDERMPKIRTAFEQEMALGDADAAGIERSEIYAPNEQGPDVRCLVYSPQQQGGARAGYLHLHGGGYIMGSPERSDPMNLSLAARLGIVIVAVNYRLAPEHPIPAPLDDSYSALAWFFENAQALNVDPTRIAIGGESAGGGLAAALAIRARDAGEYSICHQHLTYPMLDDRTGTAEFPGDALTGEFVWTRAANQYGWRSYLGAAPAAAPQVPARAESLAGLPPTWMFTAGLDLFRDENIEYAQRLMRDGVSTELVVYPGACHGFQGLPGTHLGARFAKAHREALRVALT